VTARLNGGYLAWTKVECTKAKAGGGENAQKTSGGKLMVQGLPPKVGVAAPDGSISSCDEFRI